jgi:hypothetical protein
VRLPIQAAAPSGSDGQGNRTGFLDGQGVATPVASEYRGRRPPIAIEDPARRLVIVYSHGTVNPRQAEDCDAWFNQVQPIASRSPMMPTYGNHEVSLDETYRQTRHGSSRNTTSIAPRSVASKPSFASNRHS